MEKEMQLKEALREAEQLLECGEDCYTYADQEALRDMICQARKALKGENRPPHSGCREFLPIQDRDAQIEFALERYTMAPTYLNGDVWSSYGLREAVSWFQKQDMRKSQKERIKEAIARCNELLKGGNMSYDPEKLKCLRDACGELEQEAAEKVQDCGRTARRLTKAYDTLYAVLLSRRGRSDDEQTLLLIGKEKLPELRRAVREEKLAGEQYEAIRSKADELTLEEICRRYRYLCGPQDYNELNRNYFLWQKTASNVNFTVPKGTVFGRLCFLLPGEENEQEGLGHVWIDDVSIQSPSGEFPYPKNGGFEDMDGKNSLQGWRPVIRQGKPRLKTEERYPFCGSQTRSIYLENPDPASEGAWEYEEKIPFAEGEHYTLNFSAKVDGKFKKGVLAQISFYDRDGNDTGVFCHAFNRKAWIFCGDYNLRMQCDAICYAVSGERSYAEKAKYEILHFMDDFLQGAEYWMRKNRRPEGSDAYGAVQGGRNLCSIAVSYAMIQEAQVFSNEEKKRLFDMIDYFLRYMIDRRDRSMLPLKKAQHGCSNWQLDMCIGTAAIMLAVRDYPQRKEWLISACRVVTGLLECNVSRDGSWPESLRYHHAALERLAQFAGMVQVEWQEDWFAEGLLKGMFRYSAAMQTPAYCYFENRIGTPPFGDHALTGGAEYACHGLYCAAVKRSDPQLAEQMYRTWNMAGRPVKKLWGEAVTLENLLYASENFPKGEETVLTSDAGYPDSGIYLFRSGGGQESYCAVMSSPRPIGHGHRDQGAFLIYKNGIPVVMDSGIEGYFDSSTQWHISSYSHAVMQFEAPPLGEDETDSEEINLSPGLYSRRRGWDDLPRISRVLECVMGTREEYLKIEIENIRGTGRQIRTIYHHRELDLYIIRDQVKDFSGKILFTVPTVMQESRIDGNSVYSRGYYGVNLQMIFLGKTEHIWTEKGRSTDFFPHEGELAMLEYVRASADAGDGFLVIISPGEKAHIEAASVSGDCIRITFIGKNREEIYLP